MAQPARPAEKTAAIHRRWCRGRIVSLIIMGWPARRFALNRPVQSKTNLLSQPLVPEGFQQRLLRESRVKAPIRDEICRITWREINRYIDSERQAEKLPKSSS